MTATTKFIFGSKPKCYLIRAVSEDSPSASLVKVEAAGVRHREVVPDGSGPVVVVADQVVVAAAAVERALQLVPLVRDGRVEAVLRQVFVDLGGL